MPVEVKSLGHDEPGTPLCKTRNTYCGVTLAQAIEATSDDAARNARDKAKEVAQQALNRAAARRCTAACAAGAVYEGDDEPRLKEFGPFEDPVDAKWVAYAVAYWKRTAKCYGALQPQIDLAEGSWAEVFHYAPGDPVCGKTRLFAGCVISKAVKKLKQKANDTADAKALEVGKPLLRTDRAKECPTGCRPGQSNGTDPDSLAAERIFPVVNLFQMKTEPYAAFAVTSWSVSTECPEPPPEEEEEGGEFMMRKPRSKRP